MRSSAEKLTMLFAKFITGCIHLFFSNHFVLFRCSGSLSQQSIGVRQRTIFMHDASPSLYNGYLTLCMLFVSGRFLATTTV